MDEHGTRPGCEALLSQARWVRDLARHLAADAHAADDLAQDALAAALARPPPDDRPLKGWLAGVLRNLARERRRSDSSREARERESARGRTDPSSEELLERLESHRAVVEAVARLAEPYRAAILLRYFEGLSPREIAARTSSPLRTVHTRLHRALERLREDLDRAHGGDGRTWLLALVPFARGSGRAWPWGIGGLVMDVKLKVAAAVFVVAGVCSTIALWSDGEPEAHPAGIAAAPVVPETASPVEKAPRSPLEHVAPAGREAGEGAPPAAEANPAAAPRSPARLAGRVIDVDGSPVSAVRVGFFDPEHGESPRGEARADARGVFELDLPTTKGRLDVLGEEWTALLRPEFASPPDPSDSREIVLVVARGARLSGAVVDEFGRGVEGASLLVAMPFGLRSRFDGVLDRSSLVERRATSAADGSFDLAGVPLVAGAELETQHARYLPDERPLPEAGDLDLEIVLRPVTAEPARLVGTVVDPDGVPVAGAWVALGEESAKTGTAGAFSFEKGSDAASIRAVKQGFLPGSVARPVGGSWPDPLVLRLGEPPLAIEGRVVDADGKPVEHALVWTDSEERFGFVEIEGGEMSMKAGANVEGILRGDPWTRRIRADAFGRFALKGLLPKDYGVHALDQDRLVAATVQIAAGMRDVEIRMPREDVHERIAGRVTSLGGEPVEGIEVRLERPMEGVKWSEVEPILGLAARTDEEGRFEFRDVSRGVAAIRLEGQELGLMGFEKALRAEDDLEDLEIAAPMQVHVQVDAGGRKDFDEVSVLDEKGEKLYLALHHGHSAYAMREVPLQGERTETFAVTELGRTLVLYRGETEVQRLAVKLSRGAVNTIRP